MERVDGMGPIAIMDLPRALHPFPFDMESPELVFSV